MSVVIMPLTGSAAKELPPDAKYDVYLPQDGYFVILDRGNTDKRVTPTLVKLNPKLVEFKKTDKSPNMVVEPRADESWTGKKVTVYLNH